MADAFKIIVEALLAIDARLDRIERKLGGIMVTEQDIVDELTAEGATLDTFVATLGTLTTDVDALKTAIGNQDLTAAKTAADTLGAKITAAGNALAALKTDAETPPATGG